MTFALVNVYTRSHVCKLTILCPVTGTYFYQIFFNGGLYVSSIQDGIYALEKAHMRSTPSLRSFPNVAFETVPMF